MAEMAGLRGHLGHGQVLLLLQIEAQLDRDLPLAYFATVDSSACLDHFEPAHMPHCARGAYDCILDGLLDARWGRAGEFDALVDIVLHSGILSENLGPVHVARVSAPCRNSAVRSVSGARIARSCIQSGANARSSSGRSMTNAATSRPSSSSHQVLT